MAVAQSGRTGSGLDLLQGWADVHLDWLGIAQVQTLPGQGGQFGT